MIYDGLKVKAGIPNPAHPNIAFLRINCAVN